MNKRKHRGNGVQFRGKPIYQLYSRISKNSVTGCWNWEGAMLGSTGYGEFTNKALPQKTTTAHRASWILHKGPVPDGLMVCHTCDNRRCVNPEHLYVGTGVDNMRDRSIRGRVTHAKLDEAKVREMRQLRQQGWSWRRLSQRYGLATFAIVQATTGATWKHIDEPVPTITISSGRRKGHVGEMG